jgi:hypothetical protein
MQRTPAVIQSHGRGQVTAPQVPVVITYEAHHEALKRRERDVMHPVWSLGTVSDFAMLKGELAFQYTNQMDVPKPYNASYNVQKAFTAFNGLDYQAPICFAGVVDKEYDATKKSGDTAVTLRRCGTHTIINSGPRAIAQGQLVYWGFPNTITLDNGVKRPRVQIPGEPNTKFMASVHALSLEDVFSQFATLHEKAMKKIKDGRLDDDDLESADFFPGLMPVPLDVEEPNHLSYQTALAHSPMKAYVGWLRECAGKHNSDWQTIMKTASKSGALKKAKSEVDIELKDLRDAGQHSLFLVKCVLEQYRLMQTRCIGVALQTAASGQPVRGVCIVFGFGLITFLICSLIFSWVTSNAKL